MQFHLIVTLADGQTFTRTCSKLPRNWKSWLMREMPYGTNFQGCSFSCKREEV